MATVQVHMHMGTQYSSNTQCRSKGDSHSASEAPTVTNASFALHRGEVLVQHYSSQQLSFSEGGI